MPDDTWVSGMAQSPSGDRFPREGESMSNEEDQASASVPVIAVLTGQAISDYAATARLMAYRTWGTSKSTPPMQLTRHFTATVKGFNSDYGTSFTRRAQVGEAATAMLKAIRDAQKGA